MLSIVRRRIGVIATGYDKLSRDFVASLVLATAIVWRESAPK
jgi:hypothetical protein